MEFYHNTPSKTKILRDNKITSQNFNYIKYIEFLLSIIDDDKIENMNIPYSYPTHNNRTSRQAPFIGVGIYCFENQQQAREYRSNCKIVTIKYSDDFSTFDLDDARTKLEIYSILEVEAKDAINNLPAGNSRQSWLLLLELIKRAFYQDYKNCQPIVGIFIHFWKEILKKDVNDVIKKSFCDMIDTQSGIKQPYCLIKNTEKIISLS